ncbi:hypothetical protein [Ideonella alba]|uniref:Secreted protein n=1 Tax=Ideonella alba TaxID=2824118 RepID=A0A941BCF2_9BURK|nr:hypothetical protein [Ideonella alba]MBQ0931875.1 hypothetical protein [Ideonella alba]
MRTPITRRRLAGLTAVGMTWLAGARAGLAATSENAPMGLLSKGPGKRPEPPQATLDLNTHVDQLRLQLSIAFTQDPDADVAALLAVQLAALGRLARIGLTHGRDAELRLLCQRVADACDAESTMLQGWQKVRRGGAS